MKTLQFALVGAVSISAAFSAACSRETQREPAMRPASGTRADSASRPGTSEGINEISTARCDRDVRCGAVGEGKTYANRDQCIMEQNQEGYEDLDEKACPRGLDPRELDKCLSEIHAERCGAPLDTLERLVACRGATLCKS
ncbi:MAG TPA: DUF6184 family natural product biosynthesis lipoprotein [Polyangiaceae bacterium]